MTFITYDEYIISFITDRTVLFDDIGKESEIEIEIEAETKRETGKIKI